MYKDIRSYTGCSVLACSDPSPFSTPPYTLGADQKVDIGGHPHPLPSCWSGPVRSWRQRMREWNTGIPCHLPSLLRPQLSSWQHSSSKGYATAHPFISSTSFLSPSLQAQAENSFQCPFFISLKAQSFHLSVFRLPFLPGP